MKIIQLTDLHLTKNDTDKRTGIFDGLTGMNQNFLKIINHSEVTTADIILVTGDVTDKGDTESWEFFWREIKKAKLSKKTLVIPGNHDVCCLDLIGRENPKSTLVLEDYRKLKKGLSINQQKTSFPCIELKSYKRLAIFSVNSNNMGNTGVVDNAIGIISKQELESFEKLLQETKENEASVKVKLLLMHHSPFLPNESYPFGSEMDRNSSDILLELCRKYGINIILHGHLHQDKNRKIGKMKIIGAPASTQPYEGILKIYSHKVDFEESTIKSTIIKIK